MRVIAVEAAYPRWSRFARSTAWQAHLWQIVVHVETDVGVSGYGYGGGGPAGVAVVNSHLRELLAGRTVDSPSGIVDIYLALSFALLPYRGGIAQMALSGVDLALWDLLGQVERRPVCQLLGGSAHQVRAYATSGDVELAAAHGYTAMKLSHRGSGTFGNSGERVEQAAQGEEAAEAALAVARQVLGDEADLMVDCYLSWDAELAERKARRLAPYRVRWFEDVLTPDHLEELSAHRPRVASVHLAGGEREMTEAGFERAAAAGNGAEALDLWQSDITWCGGVSAGLRILDLARLSCTPVIPHRGGELWGLHFIVTTDCEQLAETMPERWQPGQDEPWVGEPIVAAGLIEPTDAPGFGVTLNQELM